MCGSKHSEKFLIFYLLLFDINDHHKLVKLYSYKHLLYPTCLFQKEVKQNSQLYTIDSVKEKIKVHVLLS